MLMCGGGQSRHNQKAIINSNTSDLAHPISVAYRSHTATTRKRGSAAKGNFRLWSWERMKSPSRTGAIPIHLRALTTELQLRAGLQVGCMRRTMTFWVWGCEGATWGIIQVSLM